MPAVLFIGAGRHQVPYIRRVREEFGYRVVAVDARADAPGLAIADAGHAASAHEDLVRIAREEAVDGVMTVASDRAVPQVAAVAEDASPRCRRRAGARRPRGSARATSSWPWPPRSASPR